MSILDKQTLAANCEFLLTPGEPSHLVIPHAHSHLYVTAFQGREFLMSKLQDNLEDYQFVKDLILKIGAIARG